MIKLIEITLKVLLTPLGVLETWIQLITALVLSDWDMLEGDSLLQKIWKKRI